MGQKRFMTKLISKKNTKSTISLGVIASNKKYKIDDVALAWSMLANKEVPCIFRLSCTLTEKVDKEILQKALTKILPRFPYFRVSLKKGFFWGKWMTNLAIPRIEDERGYTNQAIPFGKNRLLFRVLVNQNRISVEFHHILTDGNGSSIFLRSLLAKYFDIKGFSDSNWNNIFKVEDEPDILEFEDSFDIHYDKTVKEKPPKLGEKAFSIPYEVVTIGTQFVSKITLPVEQIKEISRRYGVTITSLLAALYLKSLAKIQVDINKNSRMKIKPIRIRIPVNLRKIFSSKTMRNFSLFVIPSYNPLTENLTIQELSVKVNDFLKETVQPNSLLKLIVKNRRDLDRIIMKITPFAIKRFFARKGYYFVKTPYYSGTFSNLGRITVPSQIAGKIDSFTFVLSHGPAHKVKIGAVSFEDELVLIFNRLNKEPILAKTFLEKLKNLDIEAELLE
jgi:NRPS condensation-like uncharacterized protein